MIPFDLTQGYRPLTPNYYSPLRAPLTGPRPRPSIPAPPVPGEGEVVLWLREGGEYECPHMEYYLAANKPPYLTDGVWVVVTEKQLNRWDKARDKANKIERRLGRIYAYHRDKARSRG